MNFNHVRSSSRLFGAALLFANACSPAPAPISQSAKDPSSPSAPEGASPPAAPPPAASVASTTEGGHDHAHGATATATDAQAPAAIYVCPMHPEVTSTAPGICPKCNMKLVPKK